MKIAGHYFYSKIERTHQSRHDEHKQKKNLI